MLNACIVGFGSIGPIHANAISLLNNVKLHSVCDIDINRANKCSVEYGCKVYTDFDDVLNDTEIDVLHICVPHNLHKDFTVKALQANKHVVLEKPVALSRDEFSAVSEQSNKSDKKVCVMFQNRTNNCIEKIKDISNISDTGNLLGIIGNLNWHRDEQYYIKDEWRGKYSTAGGGLLINQAIHLLDLMVYFGGKIKKIRTNIDTWHISNIEVDDTASAFIEFENNVKGIFNATNCYVTDEPYFLELRFENKHLRYADGVLYDIKNYNIEIIEKDDTVLIGNNYWGCGHNILINNFYSSLSGKPMPYPTLEDSSNTMQAVFEFYSNK